MDYYRKCFSICCFCLCMLSSVLAIEKIWIRNTNFNNPQNWNNARVPCYRDRVIFPQDTEISVYIQDNVTVKEIVFPQKGELILASQVEISVGNPGVTPPKPCNGTDVLFSGTDVRHWYDPFNWKIGDDWGNLREGAADSLDPVPHTEKIPCKFDEVTFPPNSTFKVRVEGLRPVIRKITINNQDLNSSSLTSFLESQSGRKQFQVDTVVSLLGQTCEDISGCICGNDEPRQRRHICNHIVGQCPNLHCTDPIQPAGFCCPLCGTVFTLTIDANFQLKKIKDFVGSYLQKSFYYGVSAYISKTYLGQVQAIFVDNEPHHSTILVKILQEQFDRDNDKLMLGILSYEMHQSTKWFYGPSPYSGEASGVSAGGIVAIIIGLLCAIVIGILFYFQRHKLIPLAFSFGRFENEDELYRSRGSLEMAVEMTQSVDPLTGKQVATATIHLPESDSASAKGIDNPFYDPSCKDPVGFKDAPLLSYKTVDTRENPCYMAFECIEDIPTVPVVVGGSNIQQPEANK